MSLFVPLLAPEVGLALVPVASVLVDALLGEPAARVHPVCLMGGWAQRMEKLWRGAGNGFMAGAGAALCVALPFACGAFTLVRLAAEAGFLGQWLATVGCVYVCLAPRSLAEHAVRVMDPLNRQEPEKARAAVSMLVGRDTANLDVHGIARACVESVSENLTDGVLATLFWAGVGSCAGGLVDGLAGGFAGGACAAVLHRVCNVLDALWGKRNAHYARFGTCAARLDDALNFVPARLSLGVIALASLFTGKGLLKPRFATALRVLRVGWAYRHAHSSPNSPWSEAAFAGALDLKLGGPVRYKGLDAPYPYMGEGHLEATPSHIGRAIALMRVSAWLFALLVSAALWAGRSYFWA